jgi:hypothetical protein
LGLLARSDPLVEAREDSYGLDRGCTKDSNSFKFIASWATRGLFATFDISYFAKAYTTICILVPRSHSSLSLFVYHEHEEIRVNSELLRLRLKFNKTTSLLICDGSQVNFTGTRCVGETYARATRVKMKCIMKTLSIDFGNVLSFM